MKADTPKEYRLVELRATNVKGLKAVAVSIDGTMLKINGRNGQGKSSLLDAVAMAIGGPKMFPAEPIRKGQDKAEIFLDFGGLRLTRRLWLKEGGGLGQDLTFEYADGKRPKEKQTVLDALRGSSIADDPIAFARLDPKKRYDLLKQLVPDFDFDVHASERREVAEDRTIIGRQYDTAKGAAEAIVVPADAPKTPIDVTALAAELRSAGETNARLDAMERARAEALEQAEQLRDQADKLMAQARSKNLEADGLVTAARDMVPAGEKVDIAPLEDRIRNAESLNAGARKRQEKVLQQAQADTLGTKYEGLTAALKAMDDAKAKAIEKAKLPIPELTFGDGDILLDGLPFDQASTARKIRVSTALLMAMKPDLRVLLVREGSLLDDEARAALEADAKANDFVVLMECVGAGDGTGIVIENGEVV